MKKNPTKFTFGTDFRSSNSGNQPAIGEAELAAARLDGFHEGREQARREAGIQTAALLGELARSGERLLALHDQRMAAIEEQAAQAAVVTAQRLAGAALADRPLAELQRVARLCLGHARQAPHLVVRVHESLVEAVEAMLAGTARETGFGGRLVVLGEPDIAPGDGRIEWADGGLIIDRAAVERAIGDALAAMFGESVTTGAERQAR